MGLQADGKIIIGGAFKTINSVTRNGLARLNDDGTRDSSFPNGTFEGIRVSKLVIQTDGKVLFLFTAENRSYIARLNGDGSSFDESFIVSEFLNGYTDNPYANDLAVLANGKIMVGGSFLKVSVYSQAYTITRQDMIRFNSDGSPDEVFNFKSFTYDPNIHINNIEALSNGNILVVGYFDKNTDSGKRGYGLARILPNGSVDESFKYIKIMGPTVAGTAYGSGHYGYVLSLATQNDGKILIGGNFSFVDGKEIDALARLNADGSFDNSFKPSDEVGIFPVDVLHVMGDGKILAGRNTSYTRDSYLTVVNADGSLNVEVPTNRGMSDFLEQKDGRLLISGIFTKFNDVKYNMLVRLE